MELWMPPKPAIIRAAPEIRKASFVPGWAPGGSVIKKPLAVYTDQDFITGSSASFSHTGVAIGTAHATRRLVIMQDGGALLGGLPNDGTSDLTVDGNAATKLLPASSSNNPASTWVIHHPTGATATIAYSTSNSSFSFSNIIMFAVYFLKSTPVVAAATNNSSLGATASVTLAVQASGCVVGSSRQLSAAAASHTWSGITQQAIGTLSGTGATARWSSALENLLAANASYGVSCTSNTGNNISIDVVSLR